MSRVHKAQKTDRSTPRDRQESSAPQAFDPRSPETILMLQRTHGNQFVRRLTEPPTALVQRMQTTTPVTKTDEDDLGELTDDDAADTEQQHLSPHDQKVAADLAKITAPVDEQDDLDPTAAAQALAGLGLEVEAPKPVDEIADMEEMLRVALEVGIDEKSLQGYKKNLLELKVKRVLGNKDATPEEMSSVLQESEGLGLPKALLDQLRLPVLRLKVQKRCGDLGSQIQPFQAQVQQSVNVIGPLNNKINELRSIIMLHPRNWNEVTGCRTEAASLQQELNAAHESFAGVLTALTDILAVLGGELPTTLTALKKRENLIETQSDDFEEQKAEFKTATTTHKKAMAAGGAVNSLSKEITPCFQDLCGYYVNQEPYLVAYNAKYADELLPYFEQVVKLKALDAQPLTLGNAKLIVKLVKDLDFTVSTDEYLKEFTYWFGEKYAVPAVMSRMLTYKKQQFATYPTKGRIRMQDLLTLNLIGLRHKGTYRDTTEKGEKKGQQYGPFSRSFWVRVLSPVQECDWVVHVHYHSNDPAVRNTQGNIDKMHAKTKEDEHKKGGALADWTSIADLQVLVTNTAIDAAKDQKGDVA